MIVAMPKRSRNAVQMSGRSPGPVAMRILCLRSSADGGVRIR